MFKSKIRPILFTQYEHGRLAGTLARHWGNNAFARPALDFGAFVAGVALHDWGYGVMDNLPIGEYAEEDWLEVVRRGIKHRFDHPTTDIVVKLHIRRLLSFYDSPQRRELMAEIDERVDGRLVESGASLEAFQKADKITQLCDMISFSFCFEAPIERTYEVFSRPDAPETTAITFEIRPENEGVLREAPLLVDPWPFSIPVISGVAYAFRREGYPEILDPLIVPYNIIRDSGSG